MKARGSYLLLIHLEQAIEIRVGRLGIIRFMSGYYIYAGKHGVNLEKRLERHFSRVKKIRWHIDYLTAEIQPLCAYYFPDDVECMLAAELASKLTPIRGFGSSDCKCNSHLFYSPSNPKNFIMKLQPEGVFIPGSALYSNSVRGKQTQKKLIYYPIRGEFREVVK
jgi:Uri superfamily endonuclease